MHCVNWEGAGGRNDPSTPAPKGRINAVLIVGEGEALVDGHNAPTASLFLRLVGFRLILIGLIQPLRNKFVEFVLLFVVEHVGCLLERVDYSGPTLEPQIRDALCVFAQVLEVPAWPT